MKGYNLDRSSDFELDSQPKCNASDILDRIQSSKVNNVITGTAGNRIEIRDRTFTVLPSGEAIFHFRDSVTPARSPHSTYHIAPSAFGHPLRVYFISADLTAACRAYLSIGKSHNLAARRSASRS